MFDDIDINDIIILMFLIILALVITDLFLYGVR